MMPFYIFQLGILFFALASAFEEEAFTYPFRELEFDKETKFAKLKKAHLAGGIGVLFILAMAGFVQWEYSGSFLSGLLTGINCGLIYTLFFDIAFALKIGQGPFYLGDTAGLDGFWKNTLGRNAGQKKAAICVVGIITINLVFKIL